jgi:hypothetical protein
MNIINTIYIKFKVIKINPVRQTCKLKKTKKAIWTADAGFFHAIFLHICLKETAFGLIVSALTILFKEKYYEQ